LGNVRLVFTESNGLASIVQENHYYPFGMQQNGNWAKTQTVKNDYLYNGKELNTEIGLDWSDYGFRFYDATIGRFTGVDPISDQFAYLSTYNYAGNSPIANIDLWGLQPLFAADGSLIQYQVQEGQGPTQIAQDLNENYGCYLNRKIDYVDIVQDNSVQFANALNEDGTPKDKSDDSFKSGNIDPGDVLNISDGLEIDTKQQDQEITTFEGKKDSLKGEKQKILESNDLQDNSGAFDSDLRDGSAGRFSELGTKFRRGLKEISINKQIDKVQHKIDSVERVKSEITGGN